MKEFNLGIADGRIKIYVNKELYGEDRIIYINPSDTNIFTRARDAIELIQDLQLELNKKISQAPEEHIENNHDFVLDTLQQFDRSIKKAVNNIFQYDVSGTVFGEISAVADAGNGKIFVEAFLDAILPIIQECISEQGKSAQSRQKNIDKYIK